MLSSLFTRRPAVQDPVLAWTPPGTTAVQRYRNTLGPLEGAIVLVYTSDSDRSSPLRRRVPGLHLPRGPQRPSRAADGDGGRRPR